MVSSVLNPELRQYEGMTLTQIGQAMHKDPRDAVMDLVIADRAETSCIISIMSEDDVRTALKHPLISIGSDSGAQAEEGKLSESKSHPRAWGTFTRVLGRYVRDEKLITLEEAIRKMTSQAATRMGLAERGVLKAGAFADITIFDPATVNDRATFEDPKHYSTGIRYVLVNGRAVVANGAMTSERPGRPLYGPGRKQAS
jgi:N-acyl-D-aspartate/D-glutamate deacylase